MDGLERDDPGKTQLHCAELVGDGEAGSVNTSPKWADGTIYGANDGWLPLIWSAERHPRGRRQPMAAGVMMVRC